MRQGQTAGQERHVPRTDVPRTPSLLNFPKFPTAGHRVSDPGAIAIAPSRPLLSRFFRKPVRMLGDPLQHHWHQSIGFGADLLGPQEDF